MNWNLETIILRAISKRLNVPDHGPGEQFLGNPLSLLREEFPQLSDLVKGKRVVDFGCGRGRQSLALAQEEGCYVCGIDTNKNDLSKAKEAAFKARIGQENVTFVEHPSDEMQGFFDIVISQNAMEHFPDPITALMQMKALINQNGKILITFGPPWFAPYGSHMHFFCRFPWLNLIFSERIVMGVRAIYRNDGAKRYEDVESGLNKMTVKKFERIVFQSGLLTNFKKYKCIQGQNWMAKIPLIREFFINHVSCALTLPSSCLNKMQ